MHEFRFETEGLDEKYICKMYTIGSDTQGLGYTECSILRIITSKGYTDCSKTLPRITSIFIASKPVLISSLLDLNLQCKMHNR